MEYRDTHIVDDDTKNNMMFLANIFAALLWSSKTKKNEWKYYKLYIFLSLQLFDKVTLNTKNINIYNYFLVVGIVKNKINKTYYEHPIYFLLSYNVRITRKITRWHKAQIAYRLLWWYHLHGCIYWMWY